MLVSGVAKVVVKRRLGDPCDDARYWRSRPVAERVAQVQVLRDGKPRKLKATLEKMKDEEIQPASDESSEMNWGFEVQAMSEEIAGQLGLSLGSKGVVVSAVEPESAAARAGLRPGDVIIEANRTAVGSPTQLKEALAKDESSAVLLVQRGGGTLYLAIERES